MYLRRLQREQFRTDLSAWDGDWMKIHLANSNTWSDGNEYIMGTASEVHTTALFDIYPNDTTITAEFKGNTQQNGTPSSSAPVPVVGVGYLDGTAYKIPVEIGLSTQSIDLSTVETIRRIKNVTINGTEDWLLQSINQYNIANFYMYVDAYVASTNLAMSNYFQVQTTAIGITQTEGFLLVRVSETRSIIYVRINADTASTVEEFIQWIENLTDTLHFYFATNDITDTLNEPLQKIGNYADSISNITLTTTAGAKSFGVDTAVKPSEITLNFRGWHPKDPKESTGGEWG